MVHFFWHGDFAANRCIKEPNTCKSLLVLIISIPFLIIFFYFIWVISKSTIHEHCRLLNNHYCYFFSHPKQTTTMDSQKVGHSELFRSLTNSPYPSSKVTDPWTLFKPETNVCVSQLSRISNECSFCNVINHFSVPKVFHLWMEPVEMITVSIGQVTER